MMNNYVYAILCGLLAVYFTGANCTWLLMRALNRKVRFGFWMNVGMFVFWPLVVFQSIILLLEEEYDRSER